MKKSLHILVCLSIVLGFWACEQPESADFQLNHDLEAPLSIEKTYPFLGGDDALIDTTSEDFENVFSPDSDGLVRVIQEEEFNFGDLDDAVPEVDADPTTVSAEVGEIELTNFNSSDSNVGSAGFQEITGENADLNEGQQLSGGSSPNDVNIKLTTDYFESAIIKEDGSMQLTLTNDLGFNVDQLDITLNSGNAGVGSTTISPFDYNAEETAIIDIPAGIPATEPLEDINVDISASWTTQSMEEDAGNLIVDDVTGQDLIASQVTAAVESQSFDDSGTSEIDQSSFEFREPEHYVELGGGELTINVSSSLNIDVDTLDLVFPDIEDESGQQLELPTIDIPANGTYSNTIDLSGHKIKAQNGIVNYFLDAKTENTQQGQGSEIRAMNESDALDAEVDFNNLEISRADGYIVPKHVMLNEDQTNDFYDNVDVFNNDEAEISEIDGISDISDRVSNLTFENPILSTLYNTNLGVNTTIYAIIAGTDNKGNIEYLTGKEGSEYQVESDEIPQQLVVNGRPATSDQVIKFPIEAVENPDPEEGEFGSNQFNSGNSNSSDFFSNLPNKIRFVGVAEINNQKEVGEIVNPVIFDPQLGIDLPMSLSADSATFRDSLEADLGDLPKEGDDQTLDEAVLTLNYTNRLPIDLDLTLIMVDEEGNEVTRKENVTIDGAGVDDNGYVDEGQVSENSLEISFSKEELKDLHRTRDIELSAELNTPELQTVRIRKDDSITLQIKMKAGITSTVN